MPPPHSSEKRIFVPSLLNVAECQNDILESAARSMRFGCARRGCRAAGRAGARAAREADVRIDRDVVALIRAGVGAPASPTTGTSARRRRRSGLGRRAGAARAVAPPHQAGLSAALPLRGRRVTRRPERRHGLVRPTRRRCEAVEDARRADDRRLLRCRERHLDHFEPEARALRIVHRAVLAAGKLVGRTHAGGSGDVDINVVFVFRIGDHRVRVRATAGLHVGDVLRLGDVGDVEDPGCRADDPC